MARIRAGGAEPGAIMGVGRALGLLVLLVSAGWGLLAGAAVCGYGLSLRLPAASGGRHLSAARAQIPPFEGEKVSLQL